MANEFLAKMPELDETEKNFVRNREKIKAIKHYRDRVPMGWAGRYCLTDIKEKVEEFEATLPPRPPKPVVDLPFLCAFLSALQEKFNHVPLNVHPDTSGFGIVITFTVGLNDVPPCSLDELTHFVFQGVKYPINGGFISREGIDFRIELL